jgi:hypothetical protein
LLLEFLKARPAGLARSLCCSFGIGDRALDHALQQKEVPKPHDGCVPSAELAVASALWAPHINVLARLRGPTLVADWETSIDERNSARADFDPQGRLM